MCSLLSDSATPWTTYSHQAPLSMGFHRQEYGSELPFPPPGDLPHPGIEPASPVSPALARGFSITEILGKPVDDVLSEKKKKKWSIITERDKYVKAIIN